VWGERAGKIWGAFAGVFGSNRINNRCEAKAKFQRIMAMLADSGAEKPFDDGRSACVSDQLRLDFSGVKR
jgi:hypothetical protein